MSEYRPVPTSDSAAATQATPAPPAGSILGTEVLYTLSSDGVVLMCCKALRLFSFGFLAVMLDIYLTELSFSDSAVGLMFTLTLLGDAAVSMLLTSVADRFGRKLTLIIGSILSIFTSVTFATQTSFWILLVSAIVGVISPSGNEIGPFMAIELSALAQVTRDADRTKLMAWYNLFGCFASAGGALTCGFIIQVLTRPSYGYSILEACRFVMIFYSLIQVCKTLLFHSLSAAVELPERGQVAPPSSSSSSSSSSESAFLGLRRSKWIVLRLSLLFMMDSFGGSFIMQSIVSGWFFKQYGTPSSKIGSMVFVCNLLAGISALFAARLADSIGLVLTMVVTHLPSNVLIILVPLMPTEFSAIALLCLRYSISQMDVPTRNAYVQGVVDPSERSAANGVTNVVRSIGASTGPYFAGLLYNNPKYVNYPFFVAGSLKILYDLLLLHGFRASKTAGERDQEAAAAEAEAAAAAASKQPDRLVVELIPLQGDLKA